jgi:predicted AAA+ superfamily ATPase
MFPRIYKPLMSKSFFLFGARGIGKTTFLHAIFGDDPSVLWIDLLDSTFDRRFRNDPSSMLSLIAQHQSKHPALQWVVIDEIQKCPKLLDVVQQSTFKNKSVLFALTGSSARKLKRDGVNMLAGRALSYSMFPLTHVELGKSFDLVKVMTFGTLPDVAVSDDQRHNRKFLEAYCQTYMKEEVFAEQLARQLDPFKSFMESSAQDNGHILNFDSIGKKIGVSGKTVLNYYSILVDTYLGFLIYPAHPSFRKKIAQKPKFYFFDPGVQRCLAGVLDIPLVESTNLFGDTFEHWLILEVWRLNSIYETGFQLGYIENYGGISIDLVLERARRPSIYIEIKSTTMVTSEHIKHLRIAKKAEPKSRCLCLSRDPIARIEDGIEISPWYQGLQEIFMS